MSTRTISGAVLRWTGIHGIPLHTLPKWKGSHVGVGVHTLLHVTAPHALGADAGALRALRPGGTRGATLLGAVVGWSFTDAAIYLVDAGSRFQAHVGRFSQVHTEAGIAGLPRLPLQRGVGERRHVFPAPVRNIDLPEANPRRELSLCLQLLHHKIHLLGGGERGQHRVMVATRQLGIVIILLCVCDFQAGAFH